MYTSYRRYSECFGEHRREYLRQGDDILGGVKPPMRHQGPLVPFACWPRSWRLSWSPRRKVSPPPRPGTANRCLDVTPAAWVPRRRSWVPVLRGQRLAALFGPLAEPRIHYPVLLPPRGLNLSLSLSSASDTRRQC